MWFKMRLLVMCLLVGVVSLQSGLAFVSEAKAGAAMVMPQDCCPDECPDMPDCDAACLAATGCRVVPSFLNCAAMVVLDDLSAVRAAFLTSTLTDSRQDFGEGLQRPPMV